MSFLGTHATLQFKTSDMLVIGGLRVKEWQRERTLESSFVTMVEVNPTPRAGLEILQDIGNEEPKRKVMRVSLPDLARVSDVLAIAEALLQEAPTTATREFLLVGQLSPLTDSFFDEDPPLVGQPSTEKMCWRTDLTDNTGSCNVSLG